MGCRALAASLIKLVLDIKPGAQISLLYGNRTGSTKDLRLSERETARVEVVNYRLSPKARPREHLVWILLLALVHRLVPIRALRSRICAAIPWLDRLQRADFVGEINGGDSFSDIYGIRRFVVGTIPSFIAFLMRKDLVLLPQTYGPYKSPIARFLARAILLRASRIYARDLRSLEIARSLLGAQPGRKRLEFCPDVAFALAPIASEQLSITPPLEVAASERLVGLNVSGLLYMGGYSHDNMFHLQSSYKESVRELLDALLAESGVRVLLVPHTFGQGVGSDLWACRELWSDFSTRAPGRVHLLDGNYDQNEMKSVIGRCGFFLGSRMHACIAALSQGIPCIGIAYSDKFRGVFATAGVEQLVLDARECSAENLAKSSVESLRKKDETAETLLRKVPETRSQLQACFKVMLSGRG
jgi:colanic acid/amylovoran biosynthesis protein